MRRVRSDLRLVGRHHGHDDRAALPELQRYGYADRLATGTLAVGGTLGILIPPSVILIVYAVATEQNIAKLFMAALVPGLLAAAFYMLAIA